MWLAPNTEYPGASLLVIFIRGMRDDLWNFRFGRHIHDGEAEEQVDPIKRWILFWKIRLLRSDAVQFTHHSWEWLWFDCRWFRPDWSGRFRPSPSAILRPFSWPSAGDAVRFLASAEATEDHARQDKDRNDFITFLCSSLEKVCTFVRLRQVDLISDRDPKDGSKPGSEAKRRISLWLGEM